MHKKSAQKIPQEKCKKKMKQKKQKFTQKKVHGKNIHIKSAHSGQQLPAVNGLLYFSIALYIAGSYGTSYNGFHLI